MGVTYAQASDLTELEPKELSERLSAVVRAAVPWLHGLSDVEASRPEREGKWSAKQVVGHLTDSAVNNLARVVRLQITPGQSLPGYEQVEWVNLQHYAERDWPKVLGLWMELNDQMAWMIARVPKARLKNDGVVAGEPLTLGYLVEDYIAHMEHHLRAMRAWIG